MGSLLALRGSRVDSRQCKKKWPVPPVRTGPVGWTDWHQIACVLLHSLLCPRRDANVLGVVCVWWKAEDTQGRKRLERFSNKCGLIIGITIVWIAGSESSRGSQHGTLQPSLWSTCENNLLTEVELRRGKEELLILPAFKLNLIEKQTPYWSAITQQDVDSR